jgi:glutamate decarboxylase
MEEKILSCQQSGLTIFFVGITGGSTVLGAFDPIDDIAQVCRKYKIWLHVDVKLLSFIYIRIISKHF